MCVDWVITVVGATVYRVKFVTAVVAFVATSTPSRSGSRSTRKNESDSQLAKRTSTMTLPSRYGK